MSPIVPLTPEVLVPRLGDALVDKGLITSAQQQAALERQSELRKAGQAITFGQILIEMGYISQKALDEVVTEQIISLRSALQEANRTLEERVRQRTAELQQALQKLSELNQLKANFISNVSHELRTPLTHIKGYMELIISQELGAINPDQERALSVMQRATDRLERLIEDLILFSTVERGEISLHPARIQLYRVCQAAINRMVPRAQQKNIEIELKSSDPEPYVIGDEDRINWVLLQLLDNAIKFSADGTVITVRIAAEGTSLRLSVIDQGIGIAQNRLEEIFEPFHQLDSSSTRRYGGTGLGLTLAKKIVEAHGATLHVSSKEGYGSTFDFLLKRYGV